MCMKELGEPQSTFSQIHIFLIDVLPLSSICHFSFFFAAFNFHYETLLYETFSMKVYGLVEKIHIM